MIRDVAISKCYGWWVHVGVVMLFCYSVVQPVVDHTDGFSFSASVTPILGLDMRSLIYRQGFVFSKDGSYIIRAHYEAGGEPYDIDFPLQVGEESPVGVIGFAVGLLAVILLGANLSQSRRLQRVKMQSGARHRT